MRKINDKAVETIFVIAAALGVLIIVAQILIGTISGIINLFI
jgi:hypothetical protein